MRKTTVAVWTLLGAYVYAASASDVGRADVDAVIVSSLKYGGYHDPGFVQLENPNGSIVVGWFYYRFIEHGDIETWKVGETIETAFKPGVGAGIVRTRNRQFYKLAFSQQDNPIDALSERCIAAPGGQTTAGRSECLRQEAKRWDEEYQYYRTDLAGGSPSKLEDELLAFETAWKAYRDKFFSLRSAQSGSETGTIEIVNSAALSASFSADRVHLILSLY